MNDKNPVFYNVCQCTGNTDIINTEKLREIKQLLTESYGLALSADQMHTMAAKLAIISDLKMESAIKIMKENNIINIDTILLEIRTEVDKNERTSHM